MTLNFTILTPDDLDFIIDNLWDRGIEEVMLYGLKSKDELHTHLISMAHKHGYCLLLDDEPVAAFGACQPQGLLYSTWFIATDRFCDAGTAITRFLRGFIRDQLANQPPGTQLELISAVQHLAAPRWFSTLGFTRQDASNTVFNRYLYTKNLKDRLT